MPSLRYAVTRRPRQLLLGAPPLDMEVMETRIEDYRRKGAKIGRNVRLLGRLDGFNPRPVSIGNCCVIGQRSAVITHCAIRGARPVIIEDHVWIRFVAVIPPVVTAGTHSIVGVGAIGPKDVPS